MNPGETSFACSCPFFPALPDRLKLQISQISYFADRLLNPSVACYITSHKDLLSDSPINTFVNGE
jgi:hypothetical protein